MALDAYLQECRTRVLEELRGVVPPTSRHQRQLYDLIFDYPMRKAKALRPGLCIATCRALGGTLDAVVRCAAVLELYHNAFLVHDDIEDGSLLRRGEETLHQKVGVPIAINVGDAMLCLTLQPLLDNVEVLGLGPSLRILEAVAEMTRQTVEGQALELDWVRSDAWDLTDRDYVQMVIQKTGWYSFITPIRVGAIAAGAEPTTIAELSDFALKLSVAFQIQDDVLNLAGDEAAYGKELAGDLWEGKRTLILLHCLREASPSERQEAQRILALPRPEPTSSRAHQILRLLVAEEHLTPAGVQLLDREGLLASPVRVKRESEVAWLLDLVHRTGSLDYARGVAAQWAASAGLLLEGIGERLPPSVHFDVLRDVTEYVHRRVR